MAGNGQRRLGDEGPKAKGAPAFRRDLRACGGRKWADSSVRFKAASAAPEATANEGRMPARRRGQAWGQMQR